MATIYLIVNALLYGPAIFIDYPKNFFAIKANHGDGFYYNLLGLVRYLPAININILFFATTIVYTLALSLTAHFKDRLPLDILYSSIIIFMLTLTFHTMYTDLVFLFIPVVFFFLSDSKTAKYVFVPVMFILSYSFYYGWDFLIAPILLIIAFTNLLFIKKLI